MSLTVARTGRRMEWQTTWVHIVAARAHARPRVAVLYSVQHPEQIAMESAGGKLSQEGRSHVGQVPGVSRVAATVFADLLPSPQFGVQY